MTAGMPAISSTTAAEVATGKENHALPGWSDLCSVPCNLSGAARNSVRPLVSVRHS